MLLSHLKVLGVELLVSMGMQVAKSLMQLIHEDTVVGLAEVLVGIASELVVSVDHAANSLHDPLGLVDGTHNVLIAIEDGQRHFIDCGYGYIRCYSSGLTVCVFFRELLEASLDAVLEVMLQGFGRNGLCSPDMVLLTPRSSEVCAYIRLEVLPVVPEEAVEANHFDVTV